MAAHPGSARLESAASSNPSGYVSAHLSLLPQTHDTRRPLCSSTPKLEAMNNPAFSSNSRSHSKIIAGVISLLLSQRQQSSLTPTCNPAATTLFQFNWHPLLITGSPLRNIHLAKYLNQEKQNANTFPPPPGSFNH